VQITVGLGPRLLESIDGGTSWTDRSRTVPPPTEPKLHGVRDGMRPSIPAGWQLSHVQAGPEEIGLAAGQEPVVGVNNRSSTARFWRTGDGGGTWNLIEPNIGRWGRMRAWPSWPPEAVDSVVVLAGDWMAFAWDDPWLYDGPNSHMVFSADGGTRWRYVRVPDGCIELARGPGSLRAFRGDRFVTPSTSGSLRCETIQLEWNRPAGYRQGFLPFRDVQFISESDGFALCVTWPPDEPGKLSEQLPSPLIGLARTENGGRRWEVAQVWEGPRDTDLNERHKVTLDVRA